MSTLQEIGLRHGSDKFTRHDFAPVYEQYLEPRRQEKLKLLEIGIGGEDYELGGESLLTWREYLPNAEIYAIDIFDKHKLDGERLKTFVCSQSDQAAVRQLHAEYGPFDIVVDDGSHKAPDTLTALFTLFPILAPNGLYFVEDIQTGYWAHYGGSSIAPETCDTVIHWLKLAIDIVNRGEMLDDTYFPLHTQFDVASVHVHHNLGVLRRNAVGENPASRTMTAGMKQEFLEVDRTMFGERAEIYHALMSHPSYLGRGMDLIQRAGGLEGLTALLDAVEDAGGVAGVRALSAMRDHPAFKTARALWRSLPAMARRRLAGH